MLEVKCSELAASKTRIQVTYKYIALSITGENFIAGFNEIAYGEFIDEWQRSLANYFVSKAKPIHRITNASAHSNRL
jgi:hypothetical protein